VLRRKLVPDAAQALLISPDYPPQRLEIKRKTDSVEIGVPRLQVYDVLVLSEDREYLAGIEAKAGRIAYDPVPERTPEFKALLRANAVGEKLTYGSVEGDWCLRGVGSIDPATVSARSDSRSFGKELTAGEEFFVEPDGRLRISARCRTNGGRVFLTWTEIDGGHYRDPHYPYVAYMDDVLLPPGWRAVSAYSGLTVQRAPEPENVREGEASVRVSGKPGAGISTVSEPTDPGRPYRLSLWLKVLNGEAQVTVTNGATLEPLHCSAGDWTCVSADFVAEGPRVDFRVTAAPGHDESAFFIDDASLVERAE